MADAFKKLYQGQLPSSVATLYTAASQAVVRHWTCVNNDTVARTFALYRDGTGVTNLITPPATLIPPGGMAEFDGAEAFALGDTLRGVASVASMLSLTVTGDEM